MATPDCIHFKLSSHKFAVLAFPFLAFIIDLLFAIARVDTKKYVFLQNQYFLCNGLLLIYVEKLNPNWIFCCS